jgi:hypothetical protein
MAKTKKTKNTTGAYVAVNSGRSQWPNNKYSDIKFTILTFNFLYILFIFNFVVLKKIKQGISRSKCPSSIVLGTPERSKSRSTTKTQIISAYSICVPSSPIVTTPPDQSKQKQNPSNRQTKRREYKLKRQQLKDKQNQTNAKKNYRIKTIDKLKCFYTNPTSLNLSKLIELSTIIAIENPNLIFITETWFNSLSVPALKNYNLFRNDREGHGGGVAIYAHIELKISEITNKTLKKKLTSKHTEQLWLKSTQVKR